MSDSQALAEALSRFPYARFLGLAGTLESGAARLILPYRDDLIGNPLVPALHGGAIGAFLEIAAITQIAIARGAGVAYPKPIDVTIDYLRPGRPVDTYARATVTKLGRRIAHASAQAWQRDESEPIAVLHGNFLVEGLVE